MTADAATASTAAAAAAAAAAVTAAAVAVALEAVAAAAAAVDVADEAAGAVPAMAVPGAAAAARAASGEVQCLPLPRRSRRGGGARAGRLPRVLADGRAHQAVALRTARPPASVDGCTTLEAVAKTAPDVVLSLIDSDATETAYVQILLWFRDGVGRGGGRGRRERRQSCRRCLCGHHS